MSTKVCCKRIINSTALTRFWAGAHLDLRCANQWYMGWSQGTPQNPSREYHSTSTLFVCRGRLLALDDTSKQWLCCPSLWTTSHSLCFGMSAWHSNLQLWEQWSLQAVSFLEQQQVQELRLWLEALNHDQSSKTLACTLSRLQQKLGRQKLEWEPSWVQLGLPLVLVFH